MFVCVDVRACVRACVRARVCVCVYVCLCLFSDQRCGYSRCLPIPRLTPWFYQVPTYSELKVVEGVLVDVVERRHDGESEVCHCGHVLLDVFSTLGKRRHRLEKAGVTEMHVYKG